MLLHFLVTFAATPQSTAASTCRSLDVLDLIDRMLVYDHAGVPELLRCDESAMNDLQNVERNLRHSLCKNFWWNPRLSEFCQRRQCSIPILRRFGSAAMQRNDMFCKKWNIETKSQSW